MAQELTRLYKCGDGEGFVALYDMLDLEGTGFDEKVLDERNHQMAQAVADILGSSEGEKVMFAFGLAHWIIGDTSLDALLKDYGYSLVHVPRWDEGDAVNLSNELCGVEYNDDTKLFQLIGDSGVEEVVVGEDEEYDTTPQGKDPALPQVSAADWSNRFSANSFVFVSLWLSLVFLSC